MYAIIVALTSGDALKKSPNQNVIICITIIDQKPESQTWQRKDQHCSFTPEKCHENSKDERTNYSSQCTDKKWSNQFLFSYFYKSKTFVLIVSITRTWLIRAMRVAHLSRVRKSMAYFPIKVLAAPAKTNRSLCRARGK